MTLLPSKPPSICFCVPMARPVFEPQVDLPFGGSEVRAYWFATGLAATGWAVSTLVNTHEFARPGIVGGVTLHYHRMPSPLNRAAASAGLMQRICRWPSHTFVRLWRSMAKRIRPHVTQVAEQWGETVATLEADWFACFGVHEHSARTIAIARQMRRQSVLFLASDTDLAREYQRSAPSTVNAYGQPTATCAECLELADLIVAQTETQQRLLRSRFNRGSVVIRNPIQLPDFVRRGAHERRSSEVTDTDILWIGRADRFSKRADVAIELARKLPELRFALIMNPRDPAVYRELVQQLPSNAQLIEHVPWRQMDDHFRTSRLLLNTSDAEGFPNTFLQAACHGIPILSLRVDPGKMLSTHGCGWCAEGDKAALISRLRDSDRLAELTATAGTAGPEYVRNFHLLEGRCHELTTALLAFADASGSPKAVA